MIYDFSFIENVIVYGDIHGEFKTFFNRLIKDCIVEGEHPLVKAEREEIEAENSQERSPRRNRRGLTLELWSLSSLMDTNQANVEQQAQKNPTLYFVAGDCGFGFNKPNYYFDLMERANKKLVEENKYVIFVRGNHDDPSYFDDNTINYTNIKAVSDYSVIQTATHNILCIGGATSIDRTWRKQQEEIINKYKTRKKKLYWENEHVQLDLDTIANIIDDGITINAVVSHTAPSFCFPQEKKDIASWFKVDPHLRNTLKTERSIMDNIFETLVNLGCKIDFWAYGHFHIGYSDLISNNGYHTLWLALNDRFDYKVPLTARSMALYELEQSKKKKKKK